MTEQDTPKMTHDEMIDVLKGLVFGTFDRTTAKEREALDMAISALKGFEGMTNREIISEFVERDDSFAIMVDEVNGTVNIELSLDFWNAPYKAEKGGGEE